MTFGIAAPRYRLPAATRIGRVHLQVSDLERSLEFYQGVLGFQLLSTEHGRALLGAGERALIELQSGAHAPLRNRRLGLYHFAILLPDRPALGRCHAHLVQSGIQPGAADHLVSEALYLQDPDNLGIEIYRDRPRDEWQVRDNQLAMSTDPLDLQGIIEAGASAPWQGMPAGTTIGHIHLHVGDLPAARNFYHQALGLDQVVWSYPGALFLSAGGYHHHLGVNTWAGPHARPAADDEPRLIDWELLLPSAEAVAEAAASLAAGGCAVSAEEVGGSAARDPWGTALRITTPL